MNKSLKKYCLPLLFCVLFVLFTITVKVVDVQAIGPLASKIGFAKLNSAVYNYVQNHVSHNLQVLCYNFSNGAGILAILTAGFFAVFGLLQLIRRRSLVKVDKEIIALGVSYAVTIVLYVLFEKIAVNYRPVLEDGKLAASYPSTHTMIVLCIMGTAQYAFAHYLADKRLRLTTQIFCIALMGLTAIGRLLSGVHWFTDIVGGVLVSLAIVSFYREAIRDCTKGAGSDGAAQTGAGSNAGAGSDGVGSADAAPRSAE